MPSTILSDNGVSSGTAGIKTTGSNDGQLALQTTTAGGTATTAITIDTSQNVTFAQTANLPNTFGFKNRLINGAMMIDQRNAGASTAVGNSYMLDRWQVRATTGSGHTCQRSTTAPTGFVNSLLFTVGTGASPSSTAINRIFQYIEGFNVADLAWGTASAKTITVSFWVRSSLTGTFGGGITNNAFNRSYPFSYTINAANTWEYKTITVAGDTTGTWTTDNTTGLAIDWSLGFGSNLLNTAGAWVAGEYLGATGETQVVATSGATFYITGVQLEVGPSATSFDYRPYGTELALCQRYYQRIDGFSAAGVDSTTMSGSINFPIEMRSSPTISVSGALETTDFVTANFTQSSGNVTISGNGSRVSARGVMPIFANFSSLVAHRFYGNLPQINRLILSSEL